MAINIPGTDVIIPGLPPGSGIIINKLLGSLGVDLPGLSSIFGGGGLFGGGRSVRPGFPATDPSSLDDTFLGGFSIPGGGEVRGRSFRQGATSLALEIQFTNRTIAREINLLRSLGLDGLAKDLQAEQGRRFNPTPASQAAGRAQNQQLLNLLGESIKFRNNIFEAAQSDPEFSSQFEADTGISIGDFASEIGRQDEVFLGNLELPGIEKALTNFTKATNQFQPFKTGRGRARKNKPISSFVSPGQREISPGEFQKRKADIVTREGDLSGLKTFLNDPGLDISGASSQFGGLFNQFLTDAGGVPIDITPGPDAIQPPLDEPQLPDDFIPSDDPQAPVDDGTGTTDGDGTLPGEDAFNLLLQQEQELITAQQLDKALQGDEGATVDDKKSSALGLLGLTTSFLINSLRGNDNNTNQQPQGTPAGVSFGGSVAQPITREVNVFESPAFQPIKQDRFIRPDAPLTKISESPSNFPLGGLLSGTLRPQNRGLLNN
ncbi:MAG: hypothetical protein V3T88_04710 [Nitrosomonadaceae bacterium]